MPPREVDSGNSASPVVEEGGSRKVHVTPLPKLKMLAVAATLLTESICTTMLLPFVGLYVAHLQHISVEDAGYYSGILVGLFMLGQVVSAKMWGWLSDVYGRRIPLIVGLFAGAWTMLFFGMAPNIYVCCLMRFIHGFFNGNVLIAKIIISDITDSTNAALGFSMIGLLWSVGAVIGPAVGGFLYDPLVNPSLQWMNVQQGSFLARHPAFLASLVIFLYALFNFSLVTFLVPETNPHRTGSIRTVPVIGWIFNKLRPKAVTIVPVEAEGSGEIPAGSSAPPHASVTYCGALKDPILFALIAMTMCISCSDMTFVEIMPLWAISPRDVGGLGFFSDGVGVLMLSFSVPTFLSNLVFPKIARKVNDYTLLWRASAGLFALSVFVTPFGAAMGERAGFWLVMLTGSGKNIACAACFTIVQLLTGRAALPGTVGAVYGISQSFSASIRCVVPFVVAPLFAWSISGQHSFPFNHYMVFFLCALPLVLSIYLSFHYAVERTPEELALWAAETNAGLVPQVDTTMDEYRSLAHSFVFSDADDAVGHLPAMEAENVQQVLVREWVRHTAPRAVGKRLEPSVTALQHEDFRLVSQLEEEEDRDTNGIEERA